MTSMDTTATSSEDTAMQLTESTAQEQQPICIPVRLVSKSGGAVQPSIIEQYQKFMSEADNNQASNNGDDSNPTTMETEPTTLPVELSMALTEQELDLIYVLEQTAKAVNEGTLTIDTRPDVRSVTVRIAGGWVRDNILGVPTHDVDIALDTCSGVEFAHLVQTWMQQYTDSSSPTKRRLLHPSHSKIGVIAANPEQSKHLETATMKVCEMEVDFNNLRHESYTDTNSRIPTVAGIGTPYQDAMRRDFTMNALFYNVTSGQLEDCTRRGMNDLVHNKLVQTPLPPHQTFQDDPLRVLRAIRFGVRYRYRLDAELVEAAKHPEIHAELQRKVSRERVGKELEGMLSGKLAHPILALETIHDLELAPAVFLLPTTKTITTTKAAATCIHGTIGIQRPRPFDVEDEAEMKKLEDDAWEEGDDCLSLLSQVLERLDDDDLLVMANGKKCQTLLDRRLVYLATFLLPYFPLHYFDKKKKVQVSVVEYMMRVGIKFKNKDSIGMATMVSNIEAMAELLKQYADASTASEATAASSLESLSPSIAQLRLQAGLVFRSTRELWLTTFVVATVLTLRRQQKENPEETETAATTPSADEVVLDQSQALLKTLLQSLDLDQCWKIKPLLDGKLLMSQLEIPHGPEVGVYNQEQVQWMLTHPVGTRDELVAHLTKFKEERQQQKSNDDQADMEPRTKKIHL